MNPRRAHLLLLLAPALACRENRASIELTAICFPPASATSCSYSAKCDAQTLGNQIVDLDLTNHLFLAVEVHNQLEKNADTSLGQLNTNDALFQKVAVTFAGTGGSVDSLVNSIQQSVEAQGQAVLGLQLLNEEVAADLVAHMAGGDSREVILGVKLKGILHSGSSFEVGEFRVPVTFCRGCLIGSFTCSDPAQHLTACPNFGQLPASTSCGAGAAGFTVGGSIVGLGANTGLVVHCTGLTDVSVPASATNFTLNGTLDTGGSYSCSIAHQPDTPASQNCTIISGGSGTVGSANVTSISIRCT